MIRILTLALFTSLTFHSDAQFIAQVVMKDTVDGICNNDKVFSLFSGFDGQIVAECSVSKKEMEKMLNEQLHFLVDNPKFKSKGMVGVYINCEGEALEWDISVESKSKELDNEILALFQTFDEWTAGKLDGTAVDTRMLFSYEIKKGKLKLN